MVLPKYCQIISIKQTHILIRIFVKMQTMRQILRNSPHSRNLFLSQCTSPMFGVRSPSKTSQTTHRSFHYTRALCVKMFLEHENKYAYNVMTDKGYTAVSMDIKEYDTIPKEDFESILEQNWYKKTPQEVFIIFPKLGTYCKENNLCISNTRFDKYIDVLTDNIKLASDEELAELFYALSKWPETDSVRTRNYIEVWVALDDECLSRMKSEDWSFDKLLSFTALFYMLNVTRASDFTVKCMNKLASRAKRLTPAQLVQTFFYVGVCRLPPHDMYNLELQLADTFSSLTVDDLAIISMGFFKSKTPIRNEALVGKIMDLIIENASNIHEVSLAALLKVIRYSAKIDAEGKIYRMLGALVPEVPRLSIMCCVHLALVGTATMTLHEKCLDAIAESVSCNIKQARMKDLERLVLTYGTFDYKPKTTDCFFETIIEEILNTEREIEIEKHGRSFTLCASYLGLLRVYNEDVTKKALNPTFLEKVYGKQPHGYGREVLVVNNNAEIHLKNSDIPLLTERATAVMAKKFCDYVPDDNYKKSYNIAENMMMDIMRVLRQDLGGHDFVLADHILTHFQRGDIILCHDKDGTPLPVHDVFPKTFGIIHKPPNDNVWIVLVFAGKNAIIRGSDKFSGPIKQKVADLRELGYHPGVVSWKIWSSLYSHEEKNEYLRHIIQEAVQK